MRNMKFRIGDKVKVKVGEKHYIAEVIEIDPEANFFPYKVKYEKEPDVLHHFWQEEEMELVDGSIEEEILPTPIREDSPELILLEIGRILKQAGVSREEALKALDRARREISG